MTLETLLASIKKPDEAAMALARQRQMQLAKPTGLRRKPLLTQSGKITGGWRRSF